MKILRVPLIIVLIIAAGRAFNAEAATVTNLYSFFGPFVNPFDGAGPQAGLAKGFDGNYYGTTRNGGTNNEGTVFRISPDGSYMSLYSFGASPDDGTTPSVIAQGSDTNFYGTAYGGGAHQDGAVFRISPDGSYSNFYSFTGYPNDGANPRGGLVQGYDGNFYGTAENGGSNMSSSGTVFRISPDGIETNLYSFAGFPNDGGLPSGGVVQGSDSNFYGTTLNGGISNVGTVFRISPDGAYTNLYSFGSVPNDGEYPEGRLVQGSDGNFYGTTTTGGTATNGTVFRISPSGSYMSLYSFAGPYAHPSDGAAPGDALVEGSDTNLYGTTGYGGSHGWGTVFRISFIGSETNLHSFAGSSAIPPDGQYPECWLVQGRDDNFYGTTFSGGTNEQGTVFVIDVSGGSGGGTVEGCTFTLSATNVTLTAKGGASSVRVIAKGTNCAWTAVSNDPFIKIISGSSGTGNGTVKYSVLGNTNTSPLAGTMTIADQTFTVNQDAGGCTFKLMPTEVKLKAAGGSFMVKVISDLSDCDWTAASEDPFITITSGSNGMGNGTVKYSVPGNTNTTPLAGTMTIAGQPFTVNQDAGGCTFKLMPKQAEFKGAGGSAMVKVISDLSDCDWMAVSNDPFITITGDGGGVGNGAIKYSVAANTNTAARIGTMTIGDETFTVNQAALPCEFSLGETNASFSSTGGSSNLIVTANGTNCTWKAVVVGSFIKITSDASGEGDGTLGYTVEANARTVSRKGSITVGKDKLTITQTGAP